MSVIGLSIEWRIGSETGPDTMHHFAAAWERSGAELVDMGRHVFPLLPAVFEAAETRQFDARGAGPVVGQWAALSEVYAAWKAKKYPGKPILEATGGLREALTSSSSPLAARDWTSAQFVFGTNGVEYASHHQSGTEHMPVRAPFDMDSQFEDELTAEARKGALAGIREGLGPFAGAVMP